MTHTTQDPAMAALRILIAQAPAEHLSRPEYQDALTLLARADGIQLVDDDGAEQLDPLLQALLVVAMKVNMQQLAAVDVHIGDGTGYGEPCCCVSVCAYTATWIGCHHKESCAGHVWFRSRASLRLDRADDRSRIQETIERLTGALQAGIPITTASRQAGGAGA